VYKTIQADGSVIYSDTPVSGSTAVNLSAMNNVIVPSLNNTAKKNVSTSKLSKRTQPKVKYTVSILSPGDEESIRGNDGAVSIRANVSPKGAGRYQLVMDEQVLTTQTNSLFTLNSVERGAHSIQINFIDKSGKILASSKQQTFYLHKASALIHAN
jgi:hypothetical protein